MKMPLAPSRRDPDTLANIVMQASSPEEAWAQLLGLCRGRGFDLSAWVGKITIAKEVSSVSRQLRGIFRKERVPKAIEFLYFGLFDLHPQHRKGPRCGFYVSGGSDYDPRRSDCLCNLPYFPENRFIRAELLEKIKGPTDSHPAAREFLEFTVSLGAAAILAWFPLPEPRRWDRVFVGFDEGDVLELRFGPKLQTVQEVTAQNNSKGSKRIRSRNLFRQEPDGGTSLHFYSLLERDSLVRNSFVADKWDLKGYEGQDFLRAERIRHWPARVEFRASTPEMDGDLDDFVLNDALVTVISSRLVSILKGLKLPSYEILPSTAVWSSRRREKVFVLNFLKLVPGLDLSKSRVDYFPTDWPDAKKRGKIWVVTAPVLLRDAVENWDLFRCQDYPRTLFASDKFKRAFISAKMTGVSFSRVSVSEG